MSLVTTLLRRSGAGHPRKVEICTQSLTHNGPKLHFALGWKALHRLQHLFVRHVQMPIRLVMYEVDDFPSPGHDFSSAFRARHPFARHDFCNIQATDPAGCPCLTCRIPPAQMQHGMHNHPLTPLRKLPLVPAGPSWESKLCPLGDQRKTPKGGVA